MLITVFRALCQSLKSPLRVVATAWVYNLCYESHHYARWFGTPGSPSAARAVRKYWGRHPPVDRWLHGLDVPPLLRRFWP